MPRIRQVPRAEVTDPVVAYVYDRRFDGHDPTQAPARDGTPGSWETVLAVSPDVFEHAVRGLELWRHPHLAGVDAVTRELVKARTGWAMGSRFVFSERCRALRAAGASAAKVAGVRAWEVADCWSDAERAALAYTDCLTRGAGRVPDRVFEAVRQHFGEHDLLAITYMVGMDMLIARMSRALRLESDDRDDPVATLPPSDGSALQPAGEPMALPRRGAG